MKEGFGREKIKVSVSKKAVDNLIKKYKRAKKRMKTNLYKIQVMDGSETYISGLINEYNQDPPDV